ncbi:MAG: hypothetical protein WCL23_03445 [Candidatus Moraniibacteriota bacterium]
MPKHEEIEAVFLEIDKDDIERRLVTIGAERIGDALYRHTAFDYPDYRLDGDNAWIRQRDDGDKVVLAASVSPRTTGARTMRGWRRSRSKSTIMR